MARRVALNRASSSVRVAAATAAAKPELGPLAVDLSKRPRYVVVFRSRDAQNVGTLSKVLGVGASKRVSARAGCTILSSKRDGGAESRVYERLAVAVADLTRDEHDALLKSDRVATIIENAVRRIPKVAEAGGEHSTAVARDSEPIVAMSALRDDTAITTTTDPYGAYLRGFRDAMNTALEMWQRQHDAGPVGSGVSRAAASSLGTTTWSWCLGLLNIDTRTTLRGKGVRVAVLDTGIDLQHPDFAGRFPGGNNTESFIPGESVQDGNGHGTHCAGIVAGPVAPAGRHRYGVAPEAELLIGKVLANNGYGHDDQILDGIDWAVDAGARVVSMSLGSTRLQDQPYSDPYEAIASVLLNKPEGGVLLLAAAGNGSMRPQYTMPVENPAACPSISAVAAVNRWMRIWESSCAAMDSIGAVDFSAPGEAVFSAWTGGGYRSISGTSMATPHVAGFAALLLEANPEFSALQLLASLKAHCRPLGPTETFGYGIPRLP